VIFARPRLGGAAAPPYRQWVTLFPNNSIPFHPEKHGLVSGQSGRPTRDEKWATLDRGANHPAAALVA